MVVQGRQSRFCCHTLYIPLWLADSARMKFTNVFLFHYQSLSNCNHTSWYWSLAAWVWALEVVLSALWIPPALVHIVSCHYIDCHSYISMSSSLQPSFFSPRLKTQMSNPSGSNQHGPAKEYMPWNTNLLCNISRCETIEYIPDPMDSKLWAAFEEFSQEKNGSGLSATEQLDRLSIQFPRLDIKWVSHSSPMIQVGELISACLGDICCFH